MLKTPTSHYMVLRAMVPPLSLGRTEISWLYELLVARGFATSVSCTLLGEAAPPINLDESNRHRQYRVHLTRHRCGHHLDLCSYENNVDTICSFARMRNQLFIAVVW